MNAFRAWVKANVGQKICRVSNPKGFTFTKGPEYTVIISGEALRGLSADDWEIVKEKKAVVRFYRSGRDDMILIPRTPKNACVRVTFEWEE